MQLGKTRSRQQTSELVPFLASGFMSSTSEIEAVQAETYVIETQFKPV
jgi:hypothetical protein